MFKKQQTSKDSDIDILKKRFAQLQQGAQPQQQPAQNAAPQQSFSAPQAPAQPFSAPQQPQQQHAAPINQVQQQAMPQQQQPVQQPSSFSAPQQPQPHQYPAQTNPVPQQAATPRSPLEALQAQQPIQQPQQQPATPVNFVEVEGQQGRIVNETVINPTDQLPADALQPQQGSEDETVIEEKLEELKEEYDDAKLNSIIIEQVKELIEIDNNLNNKIDDLRVDLKKEVEDRQKLEKQMTDHYKELKELETSIEKFIALYEVVTNQFNPFVKQEGQQPLPDPQTMQQQPVQQQPVKKPSPLHDQTDEHFVTKSGKRIKSIHELIGLLSTMDDGEFNHHVSIHKNDFSAWIHHALGKEDIATKVAPIKDRQELITALKSFDTDQ